MCAYERERERETISRFLSLVCSLLHMHAFSLLSETHTFSLRHTHVSVRDTHFFSQCVCPGEKTNVRVSKMCVCQKCVCVEKNFVSQRGTVCVSQ